MDRSDITVDLAIADFYAIVREVLWPAYMGAGAPPVEDPPLGNVTRLLVDAAAKACAAGAELEGHRAQARALALLAHAARDLALFEPRLTGEGRARFGAFASELDARSRGVLDAHGGPRA